VKERVTFWITLLSYFYFIVVKIAEKNAPNNGKKDKVFIYGV
jgi:hypothetical protein